MSNWPEPSGTLPRFDPSAGLFIPVNLASRKDLDEPASEEDDEKSMSANWNELFKPLCLAAAQRLVEQQA